MTVLNTRRLRAASWAAAYALLSAFFAASFAASGERACAQEAQRALLVAPAQAELTARILGQTQDLGVSIEVLDAEVPGDVQAAALAGRAHAAAIVVWTNARGAGLDVSVLEVDTGELRTRRVSTPENEALASSTTAEMAALVVRSELSALLAEIKAKNARRAAEPDKPAAAVAPPAATAKPKLDGAPATSAPPWTLSLAYRPSHPFHDTFAHGFALGVRRDLAGFALGFTAVGSLPLSLQDAGTEIRLTRLSLRLEGIKRWQPQPSLQLAFGLAASLGLDFRSTARVPAPMVATGDAVTLTGAFGLLGQLEWAFSRHLGAILGVGADLVPWRTKFVYKDGADEGVVARLSWLDVWALVGLFTRFGA
jgi:hypothetical protein